MKRSLLVLAVGVTLVCASAAALQAQKLSKIIFVEALDSSGAPVKDLKATDFEVNEAGFKRTITKASLGTAPMRIALLMDTGTGADSAINAMRVGLNNFLDALSGPHEIALVAIGRQPRVLLKPGTDRAKIRTAFNSLFSDGGGTVVLDGMRDTYSQIMRQPEVNWPVFVIVTTASIDGSPEMQPKDYSRFVDELRMKGSTIHSIVILQGNMGSAMEYAQNMATSTGGYSETISAASGLPEKMKALAGRIVSDYTNMADRYAIEFQTEAKNAGQIEVVMLRSGVKIGRMSNVRPF